MIPNILLYALLIALVPDSFGAQILYFDEPLKVNSDVFCIEQTAKPGSMECFTVDIIGKQNLVLITTDSLNIQTTESLTNKTKAGYTVEIKGQDNAVSISQKNKSNKVTALQNGNNNAVKIVQSSYQP